MGNTIGWVCAAMFAFAANSLLCRMALANTSIDPGVFTTVRLVSGAICLLLLVLVLNRGAKSPATLLRIVTQQASVLGTLSLFTYAIAFSYAYVAMSTGSGALLLFGAVQITMISFGLMKGERFTALQWLGFLFAFIGLIVLLLPSASAPPIYSAVLMASGGVAWGAYSLLGKSSQAPLLLTAGNFLYASVLAVPLVVWLAVTNTWEWDSAGGSYAIASGVLASGCGYAIWYRALPLIQSTTAATVQLSVPVIATLMGWLMLGEVINSQIIAASVITLGGIWLVIVKRHE